MTILRSGSTKKYTDNWDKAFGSGKKVTKKKTEATKKKTAKKKTKKK